MMRLRAIGEHREVTAGLERASSEPLECGRARLSARLVWFDPQLVGLLDAPPNRVQQQPLVSRILPDRLFMSERGVEHAPAPIGARPGEWPAVGSPMHAVSAQVDGCRVKPQQHLRSLLLEIADLV